MPTPIPTILFGSYLRGFFLLRQLLDNPDLSSRFRLVALVTDDPTQPYSLPDRRVWQYPDSRDAEHLIHHAAHAARLPVFTGPLSSPEFRHSYFHDWQPHLGLMATFGQLLPPDVFRFPRLGFFNFHPCAADLPWPNYRGGNPFLHLIQDGRPHTTIAMHEVDDLFDHGPLVARSRPIPIPPGATVTDMHKFTSPLAATFAAEQLLRLFADTSTPTTAGAPT